MSVVILALNRCIEIHSLELADALFAGRKAFLWMIPPWIYALLFFSSTIDMPPIYNTVWSVYMFKIDFRDGAPPVIDWICFWNCAWVIVILMILYTLLLYRLKQKSGKYTSDNKKAAQMQKHVGNAAVFLNLLFPICSGNHLCTNMFWIHLNSITWSSTKRLEKHENADLKDTNVAIRVVSHQPQPAGVWKFPQPHPSAGLKINEQPYFLDEDDIAEPTSPADSEYVTGSSKDSDYVPLYMTSSSSRSSTSSSAQSRRSNFSIELAGVRILDIDPHDEPEETRKDLTAVKCAIRATARLDRWRLYSKKHSAYDIYYCWTCCSYKRNSFDPERSQFTVPQLKNGVHYHQHRPACQGFPLRIVETYQHLPRIQWWVERLMTSYHAMPYHPDTLYVMSRQQAENSLRTLFPGRGSGISYVILKKGELPDEIIIIYVGITFETMKERQRNHMNQHLFDDCQQLGLFQCCKMRLKKQFAILNLVHDRLHCGTLSRNLSNSKCIRTSSNFGSEKLGVPKIGSGQTLYNFNATDARRWMGSAFFETMQSIQNWLIGPSRWITNISWGVYGMSVVILALNRCIEIHSVEVADRLFAGKKAYLWMIPPWIYAFIFASTIDIPPIYNTVWSVYMFKIDFRDGAPPVIDWICFWNCAWVVCTLLVLYSLLLYRLKQNSKKYQANSTKTSKMQKHVMLQSFLICFFLFIVATCYAAAGFINIPNRLTKFATIAVQICSGFTSIVYLVINKEIRKGVKRMFFQNSTVSSISRSSLFKQEPTVKNPVSYKDHNLSDDHKYV
uniref:Uncharacterized protein n=1 Tax=Ditylenchus dipsaci TaxID=166011 RepID=A0A915E4I5_9BILA